MGGVLQSVTYCTLYLDAIFSEHDPPKQSPNHETIELLSPAALNFCACCILHVYFLAGVTPFVSCAFSLNDKTVGTESSPIVKFCLQSLLEY